MDMVKDIIQVWDEWEEDLGWVSVCAEESSDFLF